MDTTTHHTMQDLFAQLGLPAEPADIRAFVRLHRPLADKLQLSEAPFWTDSQATFLREKIRADDDWAVLVDTLNAQLREHPRNDALPQADETDVNEGEGNVSAARRYNAAAQQFVDSTDVQAQARAAAPDSPAIAAELREAERSAAAKAKH